MPTEVRHIVLRPAEVIQAVREYCRRLGRPLPSGSVVSCAVEDNEAEGAARFRIKVALDAAGGDMYPKPREVKHQDLVIESPSPAAPSCGDDEAQRWIKPAGDVQDNTCVDKCRKS